MNSTPQSQHNRAATACLKHQAWYHFSMRLIFLRSLPFLTILFAFIASAAPEPKPAWPIYLAPTVILPPPSVLYDLTPPPTPPLRRFRADYGIPITQASHVGPRSSDAAEAINATAMRRFAIQWDSGPATQRGFSSQPLYPSRVQETMSR